MPEVRFRIRQKRKEIPRKLTIRSDRPPSREARGHPLLGDRHPLAREAQGPLKSLSRPLRWDRIVAKDAPFGAVPCPIASIGFFPCAPAAVTPFVQLMIADPGCRMAMEAPGEPFALAVT